MSWQNLDLAEPRGVGLARDTRFLELVGTNAAVTAVGHPTVKPVNGRWSAVCLSIGLPG